MKLVKIKTWDRMVSEYGIDSDGDINTPAATFLKEMEEEIPNNRIIVIEKNIPNLTHYEWNNWSIEDEMIEEYLDPKDYPEYFV